MDLAFSASELAFRDEVRTFLKGNLPADLQTKVLNYEELSKPDLVRWHKIMAKQGWAAPSWPVDWGGKDWTAVERYIFEEEMAAAGAPPIAPFGPTMCASVLHKFGTPEQKQRFLPRIYNCDDFWCQGYSEPGSGSDLASVKTRADKHDDHYLVNGQKIWTTLGHYGDWIFCLVRTDFNAKIRQEGISFLLIDMKTPGITVRPLILLDEGHEVNEVFFENVKVPLENLVFEENKGWTVAKYLLGHERLGTGRIGGSKRELLRLKQMARTTLKDGKPLLDDVRFRDKLTRIEVELMALEITNLEFVDQVRRTGTIGAEVSMLKIKGTEIQQGITELMVQLAGPQAPRFAPIDFDGFDNFIGSITARYFNFRKTSIYAGSNEIQRNIMSKMGLGL